MEIRTRTRKSVKSDYVEKERKILDFMLYGCSDWCILFSSPPKKKQKKNSYVSMVTFTTWRCKTTSSILCQCVRSVLPVRDSSDDRGHTISCRWNCHWILLSFGKIFCVTTYVLTIVSSVKRQLLSLSVLFNLYLDLVCEHFVNEGRYQS